MASYYPLPFFATPNLLPEPLPTDEAITASQDVLQEYSGRCIVRVGTHFIVKYGAGVSLAEGEHMMFVRESSPMTPVPIVYALYSHQHDGHRIPTNYIIMENIPGHSLRSLWPSLDIAAKEDLASKLRHYFTQLRQIPSPGYFGTVGKRPFVDSVFWVEEEWVGKILDEYLNEYAWMDMVFRELWSRAALRDLSCNVL